MIVGIGIDVVDVPRIERTLREHGEPFLRRVFTEQERADCESRADRFQALAARFAAKEACLKALGTGWAGGLTLGDVSVAREPSGAPRIVLTGAAATRAVDMGVQSIQVSLTHQGATAAAVVVLER